jgi:DNA-binding MarR family transcriptional regulator
LRLDRRAGFLVTQLGTHRHRRFAERLAPFDLQPRHFGMLSQLAAHEGRSQQALGAALGMHRSAVVALVDDLERRGLAERRQDPSDRRAHALFLTPAGRELLARLEDVAEQDEDEFLHDLDPSERAALVALLQRLAVAQGLAAGVHPGLESPGGEPER